MFEAIYSDYQSSATIQNCTFYRNYTDSNGSGGGIYNYQSSPIIQNCILWSNTARYGSQIYSESSTQLVNYCDVEGGWSGEGNVSSDPLFVNPTIGNLRLKMGSSCVNTGTNETWMSTATDLDGLPRIAGGFVDMGAYEYGLGDIARVMKLEGNMSFGDVEIGSSSNRVLTISNTGNVPLRIYSINYPLGFSGAFSGSIDSGASTNVTVIFTPVPGVSHEGVLTVNSDRNAGANTIAVSGRGRGTPSMLAPPGVLAAWDFYGLRPATITATATAYTVSSVPVLNRIELNRAGPSNCYAASGFIPDSALTDAVGSGKYFEFSLSNKVPIEVSGISMSIYRSAAGPTGFTLRVSSNSQFGDYVDCPHETTHIYSSLGTSNLSVSGSTVYFRLYGYGHNIGTNISLGGFAGTTNGLISSGVDSTVYDLIIYGRQSGDFICTTNDDGTLSIVNYDGLGAVEVPEAINGTPVTGIGNGAFYGNLTSLTIPACITNIGDSAFAWCLGLLSITVDPLNPAYCSEDGVLFNKSKRVLIQYPAGKCGSYVVPESVARIGYMAFCYCTNLTQISIPNGVTSIGGYAFTLCQNLREISLPGTLASMEREAFYGCNMLGRAVINGCNLAIDDWTFGCCSSLTNVVIGPGITRINDCAFFDCPTLAGIFFLGNPPEVGSDVFFNDDSLVVYRLPEAIGWPSIPDPWVGRPTALWVQEIPVTVPDGWKMQYFGTTNIDPEMICSNRINTLRQAYIAGLNPHDPAARFGITDHLRDALHWNAVSGRVYSVWWTTNLLNGFQCLESNIPWTRGSFSNQTQQPCEYYKITVELAP